MINSHDVKNKIIDIALSITEVVVSIIEAISIIVGIIGANVADIAFGTIALNFMFSGSNLLIAGITPVLYISLAVSAGTSAIQIYLWTLLRKRGIGLKEIGNFKKLPTDLKYFLVGAGIIWLSDTILDISPLSLLMRNSLFEGSEMYVVVKFIIYLLVFLLCGFAEPLTANMNAMLEGGRISPLPRPTYKPNNPIQPNNNSKFSGKQPSNNFKPVSPQQTKNTNDYFSQLENKRKQMSIDEMNANLDSLTGLTEPTYHPRG